MFSLYSTLLKQYYVMSTLKVYNKMNEKQLQLIFSFASGQSN